MHTTCVLGPSCAWYQAHILCASTFVLGPKCTWSELYLVASTHSSWNQGGTQKSSNLGGSFNKIRTGVLILRAPGSFVRHFEKAELNICLFSAWTNLLLHKTYIQREILSTHDSLEKIFVDVDWEELHSSLPAVWLSHKKSGAYNLSLYSWQSVLVVVPMCPCRLSTVLVLVPMWLCRLSTVVSVQVLMLTHATGWLEITLKS